MIIIFKVSTEDILVLFLNLNDLIITLLRTKGVFHYYAKYLLFRFLRLCQLQFLCLNSLTLSSKNIGYSNQPLNYRSSVSRTISAIHLDFGNFLGNRS